MIATGLKPVGGHFLDFIMPSRVMKSIKKKKKA
jgi:hypothetical protein